jgi:hypothetical protein
MNDPATEQKEATRSFQCQSVSRWVRPAMRPALSPAASGSLHAAIRSRHTQNPAFYLRYLSLGCCKFGL